MDLLNHILCAVFGHDRITLRNHVRICRRCDRNLFRFYQKRIRA